MLVRAFVGFAIAVAMHMKNGWWLDAGDRVRAYQLQLSWQVGSSAWYASG